MTPLVSILLGIVAVLLVTAFTGWFVAQEFAFLAVDRTRLKARASGDDADAARARAVLDVTRRTSFMLSGAQLGITVTGLLVGYVAEPLIGLALGELLSGPVSTGVAMAIGGVAALLFSTVVQMLFGELYPKNYAIAEPDRSARALAPSTRLYLTLFGPLIWVFDKAAEALLGLFGQEPVHDVEQAASERDLAQVVSRSAQQGELDDDVARLIGRILDFPGRDVEHAMVPRSRVDVVRAEQPIGEVRALMAREHTRYPVLDEDDRIVGVAHLVDLLGHPADSIDPVGPHARPPLVLADLTPLPVAAHRMHGESRLACVVDEFGTFVGIVTLEDLAEEVVGEIEDEHDHTASEARVVHLAPTSWELPADLHLDDLAHLVGVTIPENDRETIAGLVIEAHGGLPAVGDRVRLDLPPDAARLADDDEPPARWLEVTVLSLDHFVPALLRVDLRDEGRDEGPDEGHDEGHDEGRDAR